MSKSRRMNNITHQLRSHATQAMKMAATMANRIHRVVLISDILRLKSVLKRFHADGLLFSVIGWDEVGEAMIISECQEGEKRR